MSDAATRARLKTLYPDIACRILRVYEDMGRVHKMPMKLVEAMRSLERQQENWAKGRKWTGSGWIVIDPKQVVTSAPPGRSLHHYGCAGDSAFQGVDPYLEKTKDRKWAQFLWAEYGRFAKAHGLTWGGDWTGIKNDRPHVQMTYGLSLDQIIQLYQVNGISSVWAQFDRIRGIPQGSEWLGPTARARMIQLGQIDA